MEEVTSLLELHQIKSQDKVEMKPSLGDVFVNLLAGPPGEVEIHEGTEGPTRWGPNDPRRLALLDSLVC